MSLDFVFFVSVNLFSHLFHIRNQFVSVLQVWLFTMDILDAKLAKVSLTILVFGFAGLCLGLDINGIVELFLSKLFCDRDFKFFPHFVFQSFISNFSISSSFSLNLLCLFLFKLEHLFLYYYFNFSLVVKIFFIVAKDRSQNVCLFFSVLNTFNHKVNWFENKQL